MGSDEGQAHYRRRKASEPVFGWIKRVLGIDRFSIRGLANVQAEWPRHESASLASHGVEFRTSPVVEPPNQQKNHMPSRS